MKGKFNSIWHVALALVLLLGFSLVPVMPAMAASAPTVTSISPTTGTTPGGTTITITGTGFISGATVTIGGTPATNVAWVSATSLTATTPLGTAGAKDVVVTNPDTGSVTVTGGFTYVARVSPVGLGTAGNFTILAQTGISATGTAGTMIVGDIGISPAAASYITGFSLIADSTNTFATSSLVTGKVYAADYAPPTPANMTTAIGDMGTAYNAAAGYAATYPADTPSGGDITGMTLAPGVYKWSSGVSIAAAGVTLSGSASDVWVFEIAGNLTVASAAHVNLSGGAQAKNIFWQVAGQTNLGTTAVFNGNILCKTLIALNTGARLNGRALAQTAVTLDGNPVTVANAPAVTGISPSSGPLAGSTPVTIGGTGFVSGATVSIGGSPATGVVFGSATSITATTPGGLTIGAKDVLVTNPDTQSSTLTSGFNASSTKAITAFNFNALTPAVIGVVNESAKTIALTVPFGTAVTALVPTITITGASVAPASGAAQNFTSAVTYTVTAADGSTQAYTVTVTVALNPAKAITAFNFNALTPAVVGVITEGTHTIALTVPFGTAVTALVPTITITGASVAPASGAAQNFTSAVTYTVTAADGSTQAYTVTVTVALNPAKAITAFNFNALTPAVIGVINESAKTIALTVPNGTDLTALVATFTTTGASVKVGAAVQTSGTTANNFTGAVAYTVTAADSSTATYNVTVTVAANTAKAITAFNFNALTPVVTGVINESAKTIALTVPNGTDLTALVATFTTTGASVKVGAAVQTSGTTANNFTGAVAYTVTAADSSTATYNVTVTVAASSAKAVTAYSFAGYTGAAGTINEAAKTIAVTVPNGTDLTALVATFATTGASVKVGAAVQTSGTTANNFTGAVAYTVTAADSSTATYNVTVTVAASSAKAITAYSFAGYTGAAGTINEAAKTIAVTVPNGTDLTALVATFTTTGTVVNVGAAVQTSAATANNFTGAVAYTVTAADNSTATYNVTVTIAASSAKALTAYSFAGYSGAVGTINESAKTIALTVPNGTDLTALVATFTTTGASVKVGAAVQTSGTTANNFSGVVAYTVTAADNSTATYNVTVTIAASSAKALTAYSFAGYTGAAGTINEAAKTIVVTVPSGTNLTALVATFTTTGTVVNVGAAVQTSAATANNFSSPVAYIVTAADSSTATYNVTVIVAASTGKAITAYSFAGYTGAAGTINEAAKTIAVTVPNGTDLTALVATFTTTGASVKVGAAVQTSAATANNFTSPVAYIVTAADSSTATYNVTVTAASSTARAITAYSFAGYSGSTGTINETATPKTIAVSVPFGTDLTALVATFTTTGTVVNVGAAVQTSAATANNFTAPVAYTVTAADNSTVTYTVTVTVALNTVNLGSAANFVILAKSGISSTGTTSIVGDIGVSPVAASGITGFGLIADSSNTFATSSLVTGKVYAADYTAPTPANMTTAINDMQTAYTDAAGRAPSTTELGAGDITGKTLPPGVYKWSTGLLINSTGATLSGGPNDVWIFQIAQTLTVSNGAIITLSGGAQAKNIFWQVAGQTTLGTTSVFYGNILDQTAIVLNTGATLNGRALAQTAVSLNASNVNTPAVVAQTLTPPAAVATAAPTAPASIQFNQAVTAVNLSGVTITGPGNVPVTGVSASLGSDNLTLTITHDPLANGQTYTVTIPAGALMNAAGDPSNAISWSFTTTPAQASYTGGSGGGGGGGVGGSVNLGGLSSASGFAVNSSGHTTSDSQLNTPDGHVSLAIPYGTLAVNSNGTPLSTLTATQTVTPPAAPPNSAIVLSYDFGPAGAQFVPPITLKLIYNPLTLPAGVDPSSLYIAWWDGTQWQTLVGTVDLVNHSISTLVSHFTSYAIIGKIAAPAPAPVVTTTPAPVITTAPAPVVTTAPAPVITTAPAPVITTTPPAPVVTTAPAPVTTAPAAPPTTAPAPAPASTTPWGLIIGIIAAVIVIVLIITLVARRKKSV